MSAAKPILAAILAAGLGYIAYPYATLYRLDRAIHTGDAAALQTLVDWSAVREGIKEDICDTIGDNSAETIAHGGLPAFGASFVRGIATNTVDQQVTPKGLVDLAHHDAAGAGEHQSMRVSWAFFENPTDFIVSLNVPGQRAPLKLRMTMKDAQWQVTRVWLTPRLLQEANAGT
ncbi:MAG TPA: DUF2939 domain-containing protein [Acetobacteraceae bacterium]|nr:DUF2939 domain-containing protein [Acetobacteraceae bacterium]